MAGVSTQAAVETAARFTKGEVEGQNTSFAPTVAQFTVQAKRFDEMLARRGRPNLPAPVYRRGQLAPFEMRAAKAREAHAHLPVLREDVTYDEWRRLSASRTVPEGAMWVACLGTVYGPAKSAAARAA